MPYRYVTRETKQKPWEKEFDQLGEPFRINPIHVEVERKENYHPTITTVTKALPGSAVRYHTASTRDTMTVGVDSIAMNTIEPDFAVYNQDLAVFVTFYSNDIKRQIAVDSIIDKIAPYDTFYFDFVDKQLEEIDKYRTSSLLRLPEGFRLEEFERQKVGQRGDDGTGSEGSPALYVPSGKQPQGFVAHNGLLLPGIEHEGKNTYVARPQLLAQYARKEE